MAGATAGLLAAFALLVLVPTARAAARADDVRRLYEAVERLASAIHPQVRGLDAKRRELLYRLTSQHPVARLSALSRYDPEGTIGFCFGRAMTAHLAARRLGVATASSSRRFIVGDLRQAGAATTEWRFHVTTLVRGDASDRGWHAIDPILGGPMPVHAWIERVQRTWDAGRKARFYLTPPPAVLPDVSTVPAPGQETGERLIELSFDPAGRDGFVARPEFAPAARAHEVDRAATERYFADGEEAQPPFDFTGISINGRRFEYNGYFADLLKDLASRPDDDFTLDRAPRIRVALSSSAYIGAASPTPAPGASSNALGSPRLDRLIRARRTVRP
jgi:hypothetical protein